MKLVSTGVTAGYGGQDILHGVDVCIESGAFVGLVGPNGCGKSTLLRALSGTLPLRSGSVELDGASISGLTPIQIARQMAFVPQQEPAGFDFTVRDIVLMGRYPHRVGRRSSNEEDYAMVRQALREADIEELEERPVTQLSGGEHRRVLVARALAQNTPLMLLDEPTAHLDVTHQAELLTLIKKRVRENGLGALAALHELNQAAEVCDILVLMRDGLVIDCGGPDAVLTEANMRAAYGARARIGRNPVTGRPMILSLDSLRGEARRIAETPKVHVVCGGGTGFHVLHLLVRRGYSVSAGVLNESDSDYELAVALGIKTAAEAPFSAVTSAVKQEAKDMMHAADTILVTDAPFGAGNLVNLELALEALRTGKPVAVITYGKFKSRDYTGGYATDLFNELVSEGAMCHASVEEWIEDYANATEKAAALSTPHAEPQ